MLRSLLKCIMCASMMLWCFSMTEKRTHADEKKKVVTRRSVQETETLQRQLLKQENVLVDELCQVALDASADREDRRRAIFLLGTIGNDKCLRFLIDHSDIRIPMDKIKGDEDALKEKPCIYAIYYQKNWQVARLIIDSLDRTREEPLLARYANVIENNMHPKLAVAVIKRKIEVHQLSDVYKKNLEYIVYCLAGC